jgi:hypothetical protein
MENDIKISICFPTIRPHLWNRLYLSLLKNNIEFEVVCGGPGDWSRQVPGPNFKFIETYVKPAQVYEVCFRAAKGELLHWSTDDCYYDPESLDNIYKLYKELNDDRHVIALRPVEDGIEITSHTFKGGATPPMAPFGAVSTKKFHELGGYDKQFICGQSENDVCLKFYEIGGEMKICQGAIVRVQHNQGHGGTSVFRGGVNGKPGFYGEDRKVLEPLWINEEGMRILTGVREIDNHIDWSRYMRKTRSRPVDRFEGTWEELAKKTQGPCGIW